MNKNIRSQDLEIARAWIHFQRAPEQIEPLANALDAGCRERLPNECLSGLLAGHEAAIRQEACLILLGGFLDRNERLKTAYASGNLEDIALCVGQTVGVSLRYAKQRIERERFRYVHRHLQLDEAQIISAPHGMDCDYLELDREARQALALAILGVAERDGKLSAQNRKVARVVFEDGLSPREAAARLKVSASAIHQQLRRITAKLHEVSDRVEVPTR